MAQLLFEPICPVPFEEMTQIIERSFAELADNFPNFDIQPETERDYVRYIVTDSNRSVRLGYIEVTRLAAHATSVAFYKEVLPNSYPKDLFEGLFLKSVFEYIAAAVREG